MSESINNQQIEQTIEDIEAIPWVAHVTDTTRPGSTHCIRTRLGVVRRDHEVHTLENMGIRINGIGVAPHKEVKLYVSV